MAAAKVVPICIDAVSWCHEVNPSPPPRYSYKTTFALHAYISFRNSNPHAVCLCVCCMRCACQRAQQPRTITSHITPAAVHRTFSRPDGGGGGRRKETRPKKKGRFDRDLPWPASTNLRETGVPTGYLQATMVQDLQRLGGGF